MDSISGFFGKFLKFQHDSEETKSNIINTIKELSGISLSKERINLKDSSLSISCSPLERTQIYLNKDKIIERLDSIGIDVKNIK